MVKPIESIGLGPTRKLTPNGDGTFTLTVTPPKWSGFKASSINLTADQALRYGKWYIYGGLVQDVFPDLSPDQCEIILSGIDGAQWDEAVRKGKL